MGANVLLLSTARGAGVAVHSKTKQETFLKMVSAGAGLGVGVKDYRVIFVFENDEAFSRFFNSGWSGSGQADAAAKAGTSGGAYSGAVRVEPGVWVYQITKNGLALQLTLQVRSTIRTTTSTNHSHCSQSANPGAVVLHVYEPLIDKLCIEAIARIDPL